MSCSTGSEKIFEPINLKGHTVMIDSSLYMMTTNFHIGNIFIYGKSLGDYSYYGSLYKDNKLSKAELLFRVGHGHNEFNHIIFGKGSHNSLLLLDNPPMPTSLTIISETDSIEAIKQAKEDGGWKKIDLTKIKSLRFTSDAFYSISDSSILIAGTTYDRIGHVLSIVDFKKNTIRPLDYWPDDDVKVDSMVKQAVYSNNGKIFGNGNGSFLFQCARGKFAFLFTIDGDKVNVVKKIYTVYPDYYTNDGRNYKLKSRSAEELMITTDDNCIFVLLKETDGDGKKLEDWSPVMFGNTIEIYDWNGNKKNELQLDHYGNKIMLSEDGKMLFLFANDFSNENFKQEVWTYDLSGIK